MLENNENEKMNELILSMFNENNINNLDVNVVKTMADLFYKQEIKNQFLQMNNRINAVESLVSNHDSRIGSLEIEQRQTSKTVQLIEHREQKRKELQDSFHEASEIAKYLFDYENYPILFGMSGQLVNLFYFGFGLLTKNFIPIDSILSKSAKESNNNEKLFYIDMKKKKRDSYPYYPANVIKIKNIFDTKLKEYGLINEFYNAKDMTELRFIGSYLSAIRLNKQYLKSTNQIDIDKLKDDPKELIRVVKNHISILKESKDFDD